MADQVGDDDPGTRGSLTIRDKAVEAVACATALEVDGVVRSSHGIGRLALRELPRVDVVVAGDHVRASLEVAVAWGRPLSATAAEVRRRVGRGLSELSGLVVDGVDVHVRSVVAPEPGERRKVLQ
ncbi:Asp23/Gls24 family envelope stress response protein [Mycolicibacterium sp. BiH015]|uniref:Asp23/Gls24 family envelope stress response protein n=1 Tax=Mycolicibacterium sp. BiH015 TaxID=3018808 RepID=UPI0022E761D3|nr:Asp23/Gls24 family envelope stress response protein [Mycolicibacterium sp. BiH015]MDA2892532.1 Asp23/Gls24 family envelope stress response protein [Mycolicibacterium sp. BiH015]